MKLLSIGRFTHAKNYDNVPDIARRIVTDYGIDDLRWYIIGFGGDEQLIRRNIDRAGMQEHVVLLGKKSNPYPYIKACDLYVQPSRYEGKSVTVREAQIRARGPNTVQACGRDQLPHRPQPDKRRRRRGDRATRQRGLRPRHCQRDGRQRPAAAPRQLSRGTRLRQRERSKQNIQTT